MTEPETGWELVTDCETAGVIDGKTDLPVRAHPYMPVGQVFAFNHGWLQRQVAKSKATMESLPPQVRKSLRGDRD